MSQPGSGQLLTTEQSLEKQFRAGYARWVEDARKRLGADAAAAAPRVVSKAFHMAWTDRQRLHSQDELDAFLGANIQHGSARELSRRASAARMAHGAGHKEVHDQAEMTVDQAWEGLKRTLAGGSAQEAHRQRASTARHEAAEHMAALGHKKFNWKPLAIIGGIGLVAALGGVWWVESAGEDRAVLHALAAQDVRNYETSFGQQVRVTLDDSTVALLGPESKLTVPRMFGVELRAVRVEGVVNFDVRRSGEMVFDVRAGEAAIFTPGPANFTVRRFRDEPAAIINAKRGALDVRGGSVTRQVAEGMSLQVPDSGDMSVPATELVSEATSWVDGTVTIQGRTLKDALPLMKRWFGIEVRVPDTTLLTRSVFISAPMGSQRTAISSVEQSGGLRFDYVGQNMVFTDTPASRGARRRPR